MFASHWMIFRHLGTEETIPIAEIPFDSRNDKAAELRGVLERYAAIDDSPTHGEKAGVPPRERFFWYLTLECGTWAMQRELDWLEKTIERIRNKEYEAGPRILPPPQSKES